MKCEDILGWIQVFLYLLCCKCLCLQSCLKSKEDAPPSKIPVKALLLGLCKAGKTSFAKNFQTVLQAATPSASFPLADCAAEYTATAGCVFHKEIAYRDFKLTLQEIGGGYKKYWKKYTKGCQGLIYLVNDDIKASIDALESFAVGNQDVRDWPVCILSSFTDQKGGSQAVVELETYINSRHMLKAWLPNMYIAKVASYSSPVYTAVAAEHDLRQACNYLCAGMMENMLQALSSSMESMK